MGSYWRWPAIRLNQINWYALVYAAERDRDRQPAAAAPRPAAADRALRRRGRAGRAGVAGNLGPGCASTTCRTCGRSAPMNTDSAEYANITASFTREYAQARRAGMRAPSPGRAPAAAPAG